MTDWFETLFGFRETRDAVYANLHVDGRTLHSRANGRSFHIGALETPTLAELHSRVNPNRGAPIQVRNIAGDAADLHSDPDNAHAFFQAASQFNLLEMTSPAATPEQGVTGYAYDHTQGPACAIAAAAGTVYRNYFVLVDGRIGQTADRQINCLSGVQQRLAKGADPCFEMRNGYAMPAGGSPKALDAAFSALDPSQYDDLRASLRIGLHWDVETTTTYPSAGHLVSQAYCSALPLAYWRRSSAAAGRLAALVLEALYEATLLAAVENADRYPGAPLYLTSVGGGVFGNDVCWIVNAIQRAADICADSGLDVRIVHYLTIDQAYQVLERG